MIRVTVLYRFTTDQRSLLDVAGTHRVGAGLDLSVRPVSHGSHLLVSSPHRLQHQWPVECDMEGLARLKHPGRRAQWLAGRLCLMDLVMGRWGADSEVRITRRSHGNSASVGQPQILDSRNREVAHVSVAHEPRCVVGVMAATACGVDVEPRAAIAPAAAATLFTRNEWSLCQRTLGLRMPEGDLATTYWTVLECLSKLFHCPSLGQGRFRLVASDSSAASDDGVLLILETSALIACDTPVVNLTSVSFSREILSLGRLHRIRCG
jgi:hypothetical protein